MKNTQKITRAMKLVSSAKYARANRATANASPYEKSFRAMLADILNTGDEYTSPLLREAAQNDLKKALILLVSPDRGLCGGLNSNLFKKTTLFLEEMDSKGVEVEFALFGKRAILFGKKTNKKVLFESEKALDKPSFEKAQKTAEQLCSLFVTGGYQEIYVGFTEFKNALTQTPQVEKILPIRAEEVGNGEKAGVNNGPTGFGPIIEPSRHDLLDHLLEKHLAVRLFNILLNGAAAEHAARMTAMDNATNNAEEVIRSLTLAYNRARQAAITKELIEITSGAEAL